MPMTWLWNFGFPVCSRQQFPLPWDTTYLGIWAKSVAAFGARYGANPRVVAVAVAGINGKDLENVLPVAKPGQCAAPLDPMSLWQSAGYRPALITGAFAGIMTGYVAAFPNASLVLETAKWPFPGIDDSGRRLAGPDTTLAVTLMRQFAQAAGSRAILANDSLAAGAWTFANPLPGVPLAFQAVSPITGDPNCRANA
jgi:hypothetical protein